MPTVPRGKPNLRSSLPIPQLRHSHNLQLQVHLCVQGRTDWCWALRLAVVEEESPLSPRGLNEFIKQINMGQPGALLMWQRDYWGDVGLQTETPVAEDLEK